MKNFVIKLFVGLVICLGVGGCTSQDENFIQSVASVKTESAAVKRYIEDNSYIDVNIKKISHKLAAPKGNEVLETDLLNLVKAAVYRFYSHVQKVDGIYVCSVDSAQDIHVSERVFNFLQQDLAQMNKEISSLKERGKDITHLEIQEGYLNSLLE